MDRKDSHPIESLCESLRQGFELPAEPLRRLRYGVLVK